MVKTDPGDWPLRRQLIKEQTRKGIEPFLCSITQIKTKSGEEEGVRSFKLDETPMSLAEVLTEIRIRGIRIPYITSKGLQMGEPTDHWQLLCENPEDIPEGRFHFCYELWVDYPDHQQLHPEMREIINEGMRNNFQPPTNF